MKTAYYRYNTSLGIGLNKVAGKVFRIGHLGALDEVMVGGVLFGVEMALRDCGVNIVPGSGTGAAAEYFRATTKPPRRAAGAEAASSQADRFKRRRRLGAASLSHTTSGLASPAVTARPHQAINQKPPEERPKMSYTLYPLRKQRLQRSELAVPGSNPTMIDKALTSAADYVFLDCEDAVAPPDKEQARKNIIQALNDSTGRAPARPCRCASTASTRTTCIATSSTSWSRPARSSTRS